jgi:competence protein ComEA
MNRITFPLASLVVFTCLLLAGAAPAIAAQDKPVASKSTSARSASSGPAAPVNLNTATQTQLETLPGIGAATAKRILEYRQKSGSFKKIEELMNVKGIGEKSFLKLKPHVTVAAEKAERAGDKE